MRARWPGISYRRGGRSRHTPTQQKNGYRRFIDYPRAGRHGWRAFVPSWRLVTGTCLGCLSLVAGLAALVNEPTVLSQPGPAPQALLKQRWNIVLDDMVKTGDLTEARHRTITWPATLTPRNGIVRDAHGVDDSAMAQTVNTYLDELHAQDPKVPDSAMAERGGDVVVTTFNRADMTDAVRAVDSGLYAKLDGKAPDQAKVDRGVQVGLATVDARNGELLAIYPGNSDYDNATQAEVEPGSQMLVFAGASKFTAAPALTTGRSSLWSLMRRIGLTQNLRADPGELPEPLATLKRDPQLALGIAPETPARMAAAFAVFPAHGICHDLASALSVTVNGHRAWTYSPHGSPAMIPAFAPLFPFLMPTPASSAASATVTAGDASAPAGGVSGSIGGDESAWYSGYAGDIVTSIALWDESTTARGRVAMRSLAGLGGVPAAQTTVWPSAIWDRYMQMAIGGISAVSTWR